MKYLKPFKESVVDYKVPPYEEWLPECIEYIQYIKSLSTEYIDYSLLLYGFLYGFSDDDLKNPKRIIQYGSVTVFQLYQKWIEISKIDITVYEDIKNILEDICDSNSCSFRLSKIDFLFNGDSKLKLSFVIYNDNAVMLYNRTKELYYTNFKGYLEYTQEHKVRTDLNSSKERLDFYSVKILSHISYGGIINLKLEIQ